MTSTKTHLRSRWALAFLLGSALTAPTQNSGAKLAPVPRARLCVTEGEVGELPGQRLSVNVPKMRAYLDQRTPPEVEAQFKYLGSTPNEARLGSGEMRRQFGLKLRAQDACNLVYAMWRIEPESKLVVSVKSNPGQHTSAECANRGYRNVKPAQSRPVPVLRPGATHTLPAEMHGAEMKVFADDILVWQGTVGPVDFDGPVGIRSDNARIEIELRTARAPEKQPTTGCRTGAENSE